MSGLIASSERRLIVGWGTTGQSVARYWHALGFSFCVTDTRDQYLGSEETEAFLQDATWLTVDDALASVATFSLAMVSPGVALDHPLVQALTSAGVRIVGDIDLFMSAVDAPVIGITGSNGKSTVTALVTEMANACGKRAVAGGNFGVPALDLLAMQAELYVLELSSFQLERADKLGLAVATVLNLSPDHLDRHGTMPKYHQAKHRIFMDAKSIVVNRADPLTIPLLQVALPVIIWRMGEPDLGEFGIRVIDGEEVLCKGFDTILPAKALRLAGRHNMANVLAALGILEAAHLPWQQALAALAAFPGLPHRGEWVGEYRGIRFINDSKGTNVGATCAAVAGLGSEAGRIVLLLGGVGKGQDFTPLRGPIAEHCRAVVIWGEAAASLSTALVDAAPQYLVASVAEAVQQAMALAEAGDVVLLSPACASFDQFSSFEERGQHFTKCVQQLIEGAL